MSRIGDFGQAQPIAELSEVEERAMNRRHEDKIVCPICGSVCEGDKVITATDSISVWVERGYNPIACSSCVDAGKTVGCSFVFDFDEI